MQAPAGWIDGKGNLRSLRVNLCESLLSHFRVSVRSGDLFVLIIIKALGTTPYSVINLTIIGNRRHSSRARDYISMKMNNMSYGLLPMVSTTFVAQPHWAGSLLPGG